MDINLLKPKVDTNDIPPLREQEQNLIQKWLASPLIFASGSAKKAEALDSVGFSGSRKLFAVPDIHERETQDEFEKGYRDHHFARYGQEAPEEVAKAKVEYVLEHGAPTGEELIIAADTAAMFSPPEAESPLLVKALSKPKSLDEARETIKFVFDTLIKEYLHLHLNCHVDHMSGRKTSEQMWNILQLRIAGYFPCYITVGTGMAFRLPGEGNNIEMVRHLLKLLPFEIYQRANEQIGDRIDPLTEEEQSLIAKNLESYTRSLAEEIVNEQGEATLGISGGVDYSRKSTRKKLGIEVVEDLMNGFIPPKSIQANWFTGLPPQLLRGSLESLVHEKIRQSKNK